MIKVSVPATTANLGPGFDSFGLALNLNNIFSFEEIEKGIIYENVEDRFKNDNNLAIISYKKLLDKLNIKFKGLKIKIKSNIPICRGLGSSASLIVAGLLACNQKYGNKFTKNDILQFATEIEGHPDNVAPAIYGGLTVSIMSNNIAYSINSKISNKIKICCLIPNFELSTEMARNALPKTLSYSNAIFNLSHSSFLIKALESGDSKLINIALDDKLHQPYRKKLINEYDNIEEIIKKNGAIAFCISGAGPTLLALYKDNSFIEKIKKPIEKLKSSWQIKPLTINRKGAFIMN